MAGSATVDSDAGACVESETRTLDQLSNKLIHVMLEAVSTTPGVSISRLFARTDTAKVISFALGPLLFNRDKFGPPNARPSVSFLTRSWLKMEPVG